MHRILFLLFPVLIMAAPAHGDSYGANIPGYLSAHFGMNASEVRAAIERDGLRVLSEDSEQGDTVIQSERDHGGVATELVYVLPEHNGRLALIIEFFPGLTQTQSIERDLEQRFGAPMHQALADRMLAETAEELPRGVTGLSLWMGQTEGDSRMVRLLRFNEHTAVEYISATLMGSQD